MTKLVVLDRDGVINQDSVNYIKNLDEWKPYPSSLEAIARLTKAGWKVAIATNQSGVGRGYYTSEDVETIHNKLKEQVAELGGKIDAATYCPHKPEDQCDCRKPLPGLIYQVKDILNLDTLEGSWMVGDSLRDLQAGVAAGCATAMVMTGNGESHKKDIIQEIPSALVCANLAAFVDQLLAE